MVRPAAFLPLLMKIYNAIHVPLSYFVAFRAFSKAKKKKKRKQKEKNFSPEIKLEQVLSMFLFYFTTGLSHVIKEIIMKGVLKKTRFFFKSSSNA